jgi:hypothetical protein
MRPGGVAGYLNLHTSCAVCLEIGDPQRLEPKVPVQVCTRIAYFFTSACSWTSLTLKMEAGCSAETLEYSSTKLHGVEKKTVSYEWRWLSSGMWLYTVWWKFTYVSAELAASIFVSGKMTRWRRRTSSSQKSMNLYHSTRCHVPKGGNFLVTVVLYLTSQFSLMSLCSREADLFASHATQITVMKFELEPQKTGAKKQLVPCLSSTRPANLLVVTEWSFHPPNTSTSNTVLLFVSYTNSLSVWRVWCVNTDFVAAVTKRGLRQPKNLATFTALIQ